MLFQFFEEAAGAEQEHAAVPEVAAGLDVFGSAFHIRFFDEVRHTADTFGQQRIVGRLDVAVAGFRFGGRYAKQHHFAVFCGDGGQGQRTLQGFLVFQHVVGRQHQHQLVATFIDQHHCGQGYGRRGVATKRLHQDALGFQFACGQLLVDDEAVVLVADHDRRVHAFEHQAFQGLLEQRVFTGQGQELFRELLTRKRPETRTATT
ncbi:hypothetical protein D3C72_1522030 [compost metagenome]